MPVVRFQNSYAEIILSRLQQKDVKKALEDSVSRHDELNSMGTLIGMITTAVLLSCHLDPRKYDCARSYQKALAVLSY